MNKKILTDNDWALMRIILYDPLVYMAMKSDSEELRRKRLEEIPMRQISPKD